MKTKVTESGYNLTITIAPETPEEVSMLMRYVLNAKSERPNVYMSFSGAPYIMLNLGKSRRESSHKSGIDPFQK